MDLCCGTGTIGLLLSDYASKVYGIDISASSIKDADENKILNKVENVIFICGKAEDTISNLVESEHLSEVTNCIAIVDPPRAGLHKKVLKTIVKTSSIKKLVYVSCNINSFVENYKARLSNNFKIVKGVAVDLFPHTEHVEAVFELQRYQDNILKKDSSCNTDKASWLEKDEVEKTLAENYDPKLE